jgi:HD-GYP domain-containing protein (c-di-GMP phosphodiesterase class II)
VTSAPPRQPAQAAPRREQPSGPSLTPAQQRERDNPHRNENGSDAAVRRSGRMFILAFYGAMRAIKLYPVENAAVVRALDDLTAATQTLLKHEHELEFRTGGEFIFINSTRLRLDLDNYASFSHLLTLFRTAGIGSLRVSEAVTPREWLVFLSLVQATASADRGEGPSAPKGPGAPPARQAPESRSEIDAEERFAELTEKLKMANVAAFELGPPLHTGPEGGDEHEHAKEAAKRTYAQSVSVSKEVIHSVRMGKAPNIKKIKRVVQAIVDQILNEETSLFGLTTLRDYDEYTFTHSVNVCIFAVALGRRLGLTKLQLYDLGLAALFHDIGKARVPVDVLNKSGVLSEGEWRSIANHPWLGVLSLFQARGAQDLPYRSMVVCYEHHMKFDMTGYPRPVRERSMGIFSKIVAVADGFDAATSRRTYQTDPMTPAAVLQEMRDNPARGLDPVVVKAFINLLGLYPVGTLVVLDTFELGVVHTVNPNPDMISRPLVRIVSDAKGNVLFPGTLIDLAEQSGGAFNRTIIKTADPDRYGIRVADYFV